MRAAVQCRPVAAPLRGAAAGRCLLCKSTACGVAATLQLHRRNVPCAAAPRRQGRRGLQPCVGQDIAPSAGALPLVPGGRVRRVALNTSLASRAVYGRPADQLPAGQLRYNWYLAAVGGTTRRYIIASRPARRWGRCEGAGAVGSRSTFGQRRGRKKAPRRGTDASRGKCRLYGYKGVLGGAVGLLRGIPQCL